MGTQLKTIKSTNGVKESEVTVNVFCGHSNLVESGAETTRLCVQLSPPYGENYSHLTMSGVKQLIKQLQSVVNGTYCKFED